MQSVAAMKCCGTLSELNEIALYPTGLEQDILNLEENVKHFVYVE